MIVMIFRFCWVFNFIGIECVQTPDAAKAFLDSGQVKELMWAPDFLEDTTGFQKYLKEKHPTVRLTGIDLWTRSHDWQGCGGYLY